MSWHLPARSTGEPPETVRVTPERAGWGFSGLRVVELAAGGEYRRAAGDDESVVLPLAGSCTVAMAFSLLFNNSGALNTPKRGSTPTKKSTGPT